MWICIKDRYGKYILNMKNYKKVICPKNKKNENGFYCIKLFPADDKDMSVTRYENEKIIKFLFQETVHQSGKWMLKLSKIQDI